MAIRVACLGCGHTFTVRDDSAGRKEACPRCGAKLQVQLFATKEPFEGPPPSGRTSDAPYGPPPAASTGVADPRRPRNRPPVPARVWWAMLAAGLAAAVGWRVYVGKIAVQPTPEVTVPDHHGAEPQLAAGQEPAGAAGDAGTLEEIKEAIVKFEMPLGVGDLMRHGSGFLIDARGWIATNNHLVSDVTTATRVKMADGTRRQLEGIVARAADRDLAIVKLAGPPSPLTILDVSYEGNPALGEQVYAFGHPYDADFSLSKGIVSRVLTTAELVDDSRQHLLARLRVPDDLVWIQHDAKISPGNSGGPLIDEQGRVVGVNTFVHLQAEFGYASHVKYLRELAAAASEELQPLPAPRDLVRTVVSTKRMRELAELIAAFGWNPRRPEQYASLAELAKQMTLAKHAQAAGAGRPGGPPKAVQGVASAADQKFAAMRDVRWSRQHFTAINSFATGQVDNVGQGAILFTVVLGNVRNQHALVMEIEGTQKRVLVRVSPNLARLPPGTRALVVGFVTPQVAKVESKQQPVSQLVRVLLTHYMLLVK